MADQAQLETLEWPDVQIGPTAAQRWALWLLRLGAIAIVLAVVPHRELELDRFFVPKEIALHATALGAGLLAAVAFARVRLTLVDVLLVAFLLWSVASAFMAQDTARAARYLLISVSGVAVFWAARGLREVGLERPLRNGIAVAVVLGAAVALAEAYGLESNLFSATRVPGGTFGNRNSVAHLAAFGSPIVLLAALRAWRPLGYTIGAVGVAISVGSLVLTRSRAGWLAFATVGLVFIVALAMSPPLRRHRKTWRRLAGVFLLMATAVGVAILLPNTLRWRSANPYLETVAGIANYEEGSGRGRLVQYRTSLEIAIDRPLFGVGPGNWPLFYPDYAGRGDPSMSRSNPGQTANPWPSSDWVAYLTERGFPGVSLLAAAVLMLGVSAFRRLARARDEDEGLVAATCLATLLAAVVAGLFDAVLLLAAPTLLVWAALGTLWSPGSALPTRSPKKLKIVLLILLALVAGAAGARSAAQLAAM